MSIPYNSNYRSSPDRCGRDRLLDATEQHLLDPQEVVMMVAKMDDIGRDLRYVRCQRTQLSENVW